MKIAILGLGIVGFGVYDSIKKYYPEITIAKVLDKDLSKQNLVECQIVNNINEILEDDSINLVVESLGGIDFAYPYIKQALIHHKHVVTANKEVVALYFDELMKLKQENKVSFSFEASVGGGVPIIKNLIDIVKSHKIESIYGIINGTTNYILSRLQEGKNFSEALQMARQRGFTEADASYDLDGLDMVRKIAILTMISTSKKIDLDNIYRYSIGEATHEDIQFAQENSYTLKYMAFYDNDFIAVEPVFVKQNNLFSNVNEEYNMISVKATGYETLAFYGKGAGRYPTASAIINDIIDIKNKHYNYSFLDKGQMIINDDQKLRQFYLRIKNNCQIDETIVLKQKGNLIITKPILRKDINFNKVAFYAHIKEE